MTIINFDYAVNPSNSKILKRGLFQMATIDLEFSPTPSTNMKNVLALLSLAAAATAYPMFILEEEPLVRVPSQLTGMICNSCNKIHF